MWKSFGQYLLQKRYHAVWIVLLCVILALFQLPLLPTSGLAIIIVALVTLHRGAKEGAILVCWALLPIIAFSFTGDLGPLLNDGLGKIMVIWLLACLLGRTASWTPTLQLATLAGLLIIVGVHLLAPDVSEWWSGHLASRWHDIQQQLVGMGVAPAQSQALFVKMTQLATGGFIAATLLLNVMVLLIARAWQALLFNPGGLSKEWRQLRLSYLASALFIIIVISVWFGSLLALDMLPLIMLPFVLAGLSFIHTKLPEKK